MNKWILALLMLSVLPGYSYAANTNTKDVIKKCETKYKNDNSKKVDCIKKAKAKASKSNKTTKKDIKQACKDKYPNDTAKQNSCASKTKDKAKKIKDKTTSSKKEFKAVNVNKASASELAASLPGIGEKKAQAIIDYRKKNGKFKNANDLANVPGLGDASVKKMKSYLKF